MNHQSKMNEFMMQKFRFVITNQMKKSHKLIEIVSFVTSKLISYDVFFIASISSLESSKCNLFPV